MKFVVFFIIGVVLVAQTSARPQRLEDDCTLDEFCIQIPICAIDEEGVPRTFSSPCEMSIQNCIRGTNFVQVKNGEC